MSGKFCRVSPGREDGATFPAGVIKLFVEKGNGTCVQHPVDKGQSNKSETLIVVPLSLALYIERVQIIFHF